MRRTRFLQCGVLFLLIARLAACGDSTGVENPQNADGLRFQFGGSETGSFDARGEPVLSQDGIPGFGDWAVARPDSLGGLVVAGFDPADGTRGNLFILQLHPRRTGTFTCTLHGQDGCHGRTFTGVDPTDLSVTGKSYQIVSGTVSINALEATRLRGTIDATLYASDGSGGLNSTDQLTISNGVIDVPYSNDVVVANGIACMARNLSERKNERC